MTSLLLADIPYKTVYFALDSLTVGFMFLFVKFTFKLIKEPLVTIYSQKIYALKAKLSKNDPPENPDAIYYVMSFKEGQTKEVLGRVISERLYFHTFYGMLTTISFLLLFAISRVFDIPLISAIPDDKLTELSVLFCSELALEIIYFSLAYCTIKRMLCDLFDPFAQGGAILYSHRYFAILLVCFAFPTIFTLAEYFTISFY
jgi:hypothetical protein